MTSERKINWEAPVVGKLVDGKTYVDRKGGKHTIYRDREDREGRVWYGEGYYANQNEGEAKHVLDLIAEYAPLKMWMNVTDDRSFLYSTQDEAIARASVVSVRVAVPVTITEGHGDD